MDFQIHIQNPKHVCAIIRMYTYVCMYKHLGSKMSVWRTGAGARKTREVKSWWFEVWSVFWGVFWGCRLGKFCQEHTWQGCSGMRVWRPWIRVSPGWTEHIWQPSAIENFVEYYMLGQLTWQWMGLDIKEIRRRQRRLRERWESVGPSKSGLMGGASWTAGAGCMSWRKPWLLIASLALLCSRLSTCSRQDLSSRWTKVELERTIRGALHLGRAQRRPPSQDILQALGSCLEP